jgi:hypothetical protein
MILKLKSSRLSWILVLSLPLSSNSRYNWGIKNGFNIYFLKEHFIFYWWLFWIFKWRWQKYLQSCELYNIDDCTQRTLSYVINFRDDQIYKAFGNILFSNFDKSLFEDRSKNGIVYSYTFQSDKVVLHLHSTTNTFHFQGKGAISWFQEIFKTLLNNYMMNVNYVYLAIRNLQKQKIP